jgi:predicted RNase H-like nuclease (RuvC/YqgF family)
MLSMGSGATEKDLFEIIRRQSEQIDQLIAENKALKAEIARLKKRIEELERRDRQVRRPLQSGETHRRSQVTRTASW